MQGEYPANLPKAADATAYQADNRRQSTYNDLAADELKEIPSQPITIH
jgi:hypothetical protein